MAKYDQDTSTSTFQVLTQNVRQELSASIVEPVLGLQMIFGRLSVGAMIKYPVSLGGEFKSTIEQHIMFVDSNLVVSQDSELGAGAISRIVMETTTEDPLGGWPAEYRAGVAFFASSQFLWSMDAVHRPAISGNVAQYDRNGVTNFATAVEWYLTASLPLRMSYFTNYDARDEVQVGLKDQQDHIDYQGGSAFLAWVQPNSSVSFGSTYQLGKGKAQKIANATNIQEVEGYILTFAFSATSNF